MLSQPSNIEYTVISHYYEGYGEPLLAFEIREGNELIYDTGEWTFAQIGFFIGLETDPDVLPGKGTASYTGDFGIAGVVELPGGTDDDTWAWNGTINIDADFANGAIEGELVSDLWGSDDTEEIAFEGSISGNGWTALDTAETTSKLYDSDWGDNVSKTGGDVQLDGVFYGDIGQTTAGTIMVDVELNNVDGDAETYVGAGGFIADQDP